MIAVALLVFAAILIATVGGYFLLAPAGESSRELKRRLALLELREIETADIPDVLKKELLSDVPLLQRALSRLKLAQRVDARLRQAGMEMKVGVFALLSVALFAIGASITLLTGTGVWRSGSRQLAFGLGAAAVTYGVGALFGVAVG